LRRIEIKQKETSIQLEEIDNSLQNGSETALVDALIALTDTVADYYFFASGDEGSPLFEQAQMMWNRAKNAAEAAGLEIIEPDNEPFDFRLHSVESVGQDINIPSGYAIKTLKFGYIYKGEVVRRAAVVVNKIEKIDNEIETPPNIIYL
jgi:molecular chaperone GrpE (heat shock protein)